VATEPLFNEVVAIFLLNPILNVTVLSLLFKTISTLRPSGVLKATLGKVGSKFEAILTEPAGINFDACARV
jgi:hypothetical protein